MKNYEEKIDERKEEKIFLSKIITYMDNYIEYRKAIHNSDATITNVKNYINRFIYFCNLNNETYITKDTIHKFVLSLQRKQKSTIDKYLKNLRLFFRYIFEEKLINLNFEKYVPKTKYLTKSKIPFYWTDENIKKLLDSIDCNTAVGKRDYAILLMIINLGIRAGDLIKLTLDDIDWNNNQIKYYQHKTTHIQCLPLLPNVGNAILDYIINARDNNCKNRVLFLDNNQPFKKNYKISKILYLYEKKANIIIDKSFKNGVHSFRNTLARNLLLNECSIVTISQVLGHVNPNTSRIYLKIDLIQLRECVLDWRLL